MNQRGGVGLYLLFSIAISIAAGYGVYHFIKEHPDAFASNKKSNETTNETAPSGKKVKETSLVTAPDPLPAPEVPEAPVPEAPMPETDLMAAAMKVAEADAEDPIDSDSSESPVFGTVGIYGGIERGAVERRFKPRAAILQRCFQRSGAEPGVLRVAMQVAPDGKVSHLTLSAGWDDGFNACVTAALNFTFSATKDGKPAAIVQPIAFR